MTKKSTKKTAKKANKKTAKKASRKTAAKKAKATREDNFLKRADKEPDANRDKMIEFRRRKKALQKEIWG